MNDGLLMMKRLSCWMFVVAVGAGCAVTDTEPAEPADSLGDCFSCGWDRADTLSITGYQELGVLELVNQASRRELDDDAGLDARAANNIVDERMASGKFTTLVQLDEVSYVGPYAFERLVNYAVDHGYVGSCGDGELQDRLETCDDHNAVGGDGCSASCKLEGGVTVHGLVEGSLEAQAVLRVANTASQTTLDDNVRLDRRAAENIVDDRPFSTLLELDQVAYVGDAAFEQLLGYARANAMLCGDSDVNAMIAGINATRWNSYFTREVRTDVTLEEALDDRSWPGDLTHAGCFGVDRDLLAEWIPVSEPEGNTRLIRLFQAFAGAARRMGSHVDIDAGTNELQCTTRSMEFVGCRLEFQPDPYSGITWNIIESSDGSLRYLFIGEWFE